MTLFVVIKLDELDKLDLTAHLNTLKFKLSPISDKTLTLHFILGEINTMASNLALIGDSVELPKWLNFGSGIKKSAKRWQFLAGGGEP